MEKYLQEYQEAKKTSIKIADLQDVATRLAQYLEEELVSSPQELDLFLNWVAANQVSDADVSDMDSAQLLEIFLVGQKDCLTAQQQARVLTTLAWYHLNSGQIEQELAVLEQAVALGSMYPETYYALGHHYYRKEQFDIAEKHFEKALFYKQFSFGEVVETCKESLGVECYQYSYAVTLCRTGKYEKARELFEKLLMSYPDEASLAVTVPYCDDKLGNKAPLEQFLDQYIKDLKALIARANAGEEVPYSTSFLRLGMRMEVPIYLSNRKPFVFLTTSKMALLFNDLGDLDRVIALVEDEDFVIGPDIMFNQYLAALWQTTQNDKFEQYVEQEITELDNILASEREEAEELGEEYIEDELIVEMKNKIKDNSEKFKSGEKPSGHFQLDNEYRCYSLDQIL
ncbi:Tetratricopeptide repeat-containing protein [Granulicatella balaenopterae]|uniref:Tetratricopeptide repeat-containing protein n=1 Tax=Granulicatella balaenopterae TaxID=137733 RepID=A0A1H9LQE4_9LACT|nr:hypothetical protein [Granulicatella balaenopterae]SER13711.1 Tetratricopeptide repeat-containing protein [Granulicatella balaenopterae]